ncbi:hypothetical protein BpHYR1_038516 [Brachionus plicatilis]|uniref:Uncharacterized protein n=1 Tax=Brachionus plicatilis TaxID=10195 RepID=A0A3M7PDZ3_BRAPC|nr:hypothetical protein BpHYR1_038516 [Brachionus plicatilis]
MNNKTPSISSILDFTIENIISPLHYFSELKFCAINLNFLKIKNTIIRTFFNQLPKLLKLSTFKT